VNLSNGGALAEKSGDGSGNGENYFRRDLRLGGWRWRRGRLCGEERLQMIDTLAEFGDFLFKSLS